MITGINHGRKGLTSSARDSLPAKRNRIGGLWTGGQCCPQAGDSGQKPRLTPPPRDSNAIRVCKISFFGALTGATLSVARIAHDGGTTTTVSQTYMLDKDGTPVHGRSIDWIYQLAFVGYLVAMIWTRGKTLGSRVVKVKVIDIANPSAAGVPLSKTIVRYLAMMIGAVPALALLIYQRIAVGGTADAMFTSSFFQWFGYAAVLGGLWALVLIIQVAMKRDPVYDRLAGTAVVRS